MSSHKDVLTDTVAGNFEVLLGLDFKYPPKAHVLRPMGAWEEVDVAGSGALWKEVR